MSFSPAPNLLVAQCTLAVHQNPKDPPMIHPTNHNPTNNAPNNNNNNIITLTPCPLPEDVIDLVDVEWASEDPTHPSPAEYAPRPKYSKMEDPCGCTPQYNEETDSFDVSTMLCTDTTCVLFACLEECRSNCEAGDLCGNKRITKKLWKQLQVVEAGPKGRGLITLEDVKQGDFLIEYTGVAIKKEYLDSMFRRYRTERMLYIMALDNDTYIDARKKGSIARYINHSCEPNCAVHRWKVRGILRAGIFATKDIPAGTELSFDYKWKRKRGRAPTKCYCGSDHCRGTLEDMLERTKEEEQEEDALEGHWKDPITPKGSGTSIMNKTIKVWSEEDQSYFLADVCQYDSASNKHCLIYRGEIEETWDDLDSKKWMILDEEMEQFVIARKKKIFPNGILSTTGTFNNGPLLCEPAIVTTANLKHYVMVQTPLKEKIISKHLLERCQRHFRVQISVSQINSNSNNSTVDPMEAEDERKALQESTDGVAWKFNIIGLEPIKAKEFLEKNILDFREAEKKKNQMAALATAENPSSVTLHHKEILIPPNIADHIKNRMSILRSSHKNVELGFVTSNSATKPFAKLMIVSQDAEAAELSQHFLWKEVLTLCNTYDAPRTPKGLFKELAFLGGFLSRADFSKLCPKLANIDLTPLSCVNLGDMGNLSLFEEANRCTVWVQTTENASDRRRKIFFGCEPKRVPELWNHVQSRVEEIKKGTKLVDMEDDQDVLPLLIRNFDKRPRSMTSNFFDYVQKVTGVQVKLDNCIQHCIRLDPISQEPNKQFLTLTEENNQNSRMVSIAAEIIQLQILLFRDVQARHHRPIFGREWANLVPDDTKEENDADSSALVPRLSMTRTTKKRYISNACMEIADITEALGLDGSIAGHACVILYRYLTLESENIMCGSQSKQRDILLACLFLANKAQKECKWKKLELIFEAAYKIFYTGASFNPNSDEATSLESRVLDTENDILEKLQYDIFWGGVDWVINMSTQNSSKLTLKNAKKVMTYTLTGPVLAAGPVVWVKFGPQYAFAVMAMFTQSNNCEFLLNALKLDPTKLMDTADLIASSILVNKASKQKGSLASHEIFSFDKEHISSHVTEIKKVCIAANSSSSFATECSGKRRLCVKDIKTDLVSDFLKNKFSEIIDICNCFIFVEEGSDFDRENIILEGNWREVALGFSMLKEAAASVRQLIPEVVSLPLLSHSVCSRDSPGLLQMTSIESSMRWEDVGSFGWSANIGGKTCIPAKVPRSVLKRENLQPLLKPRYCQHPDGFLCHMIQLSSSNGLADASRQLKELGQIARWIDDAPDIKRFPLLVSECPTDVKNIASYAAISIQRWPPEKSEVKEKSKVGMNVGFSPSALQEMQLLTKLHFSGNDSQTHPNILLPISIAVESHSVSQSGHEDKMTMNTPASFDYMTSSTDMLLSVTPIQNHSEGSLKKKELRGSHLVFQPTPLILQRVMNKCRKQTGHYKKIPYSIIVAWFHDLLSAMSQCHTNHIILRTLHSDQILVDTSGLIKLSGLARSVVLHPSDRDRFLDPLSSTKNKKKNSVVSDEDIASNPYMAPELLLGATRYTSQSDIWTLGALMGHILLGKNLFPGKDRKSKVQAIFKVAGSPSSSNYEAAVSFPYYNTCKTEKKYKSGVGKAIKYMLPDEYHTASELDPIINLLEKMLVLDPKERITAVDALKDKVMVDFVHSTGLSDFRDQYASDWNNLRQELNAERPTDINESDIFDLSSEKTPTYNQSKRPYDLTQFGVSDEDGLYDMDNLLSSGKKSKWSN